VISREGFTLTLALCLKGEGTVRNHPLPAGEGWGEGESGARRERAISREGLTLTLALSLEGEGKQRSLAEQCSALQP
jgi:hypothetical protein